MPLPWTKKLGWGYWGVLFLCSQERGWLVAWLAPGGSASCKEAAGAGPAPRCLLGQESGIVSQDRHGLEALLTLLWHCQSSRLALRADLVWQLVPQSIAGCSPTAAPQGLALELTSLPGALCLVSIPSAPLLLVSKGKCRELCCSPALYPLLLWGSWDPTAGP